MKNEWMRRVMTLFSAPFLASTLTHAHAQTVWVVDQAGGAGSDATEIRDAIDLAAPGDTILVRSGTYDHFDLPGKGLTIVADAGADVVVGTSWGSPSWIGGLPAGQTLIVRGLRFRDLWSSGLDSSVRVENAEGIVRFEQCRMEGGYPAILLRSCASVTLNGCDVEGGDPVLLWGAGSSSGAGDALHAQDSHVRVYDSDLRGHKGEDASHAPQILAGPGSDGVRLEGGSLLISRSTLQGGDGGDGGWDDVFQFCYSPGDGGAGLRLASGDPLVHQVDVVASGGAGGVGDGLTCFEVGDPTPGVVVASGALVDLPGAGVALAVDAPVREAGSVAFTVRAPAGATALLGLSHAPGDLALLPALGVLHLGAPFHALALGAIPPSGELAVSFVVPELGPGVDALVLHAQSAACDAAACRIGAPAAAILLDAAL